MGEPHRANNFIGCAGCSGLPSASASRLEGDRFWHGRGPLLPSI